MKKFLILLCMAIGVQFAASGAIQTQGKQVPAKVFNARKGPTKVTPKHKQNQKPHHRFKHKSSSTHKKNCCERVLEHIKHVECITKEDLEVDEEILDVVNQINETTMTDLAIDQEILNIVTELDDIECHPIYQSTIDAAGGTLTLSESGKYCLAEDVVGSIVIDSSSVCLDLNCHTINADGALYAVAVQRTPPVPTPEKTDWSLKANLKEGVDFNKISERPFLALQAAMGDEVDASLNSADLIGEELLSRPNFRLAVHADASITDIHHVTVSNGTVRGATAAGILVDTCFDVAVFDITMLENALDGLDIIDSNSVKVTNMSFLGDTTGERALFVDGSDNLTITGIVATGYLTTLGEIIHFGDSNVISLSNVDVSFNTITPVSSIDYLDIESSLVGFAGCTGTYLTNVYVNNNTFTDANVSPNGRSFEALYFLFCSGGSLTNCSTSNNIDTTGSLVQQVDYDFILAFLSCDNFIITNHQANKNSCPQTLAGFFQIFSGDSSNMVFDGAQANSSTVQQTALPTINGVNSLYVGSWLGPITALHDNILRNCQANDNVLNLASSNSFHVGIHTQGSDVIFDGCETSNNRAGNALGNVIGIVPSLSRNSIVSNCLANHNTGSGTAVGIVVHGGNCKILNCLANFNGNSGMQLGVFSSPDDPLANIEVIDCVANDNGTSTGLARGINFTAGTNNIFIKGCQINNTGTASSSAALGIRIFSGSSNVVVEDTEVINTTSSTTGVGISFSGVTNGKILRTEVLGSKNQGVQTSGTCANIIVDGSYAINNGSNGFEFSTGTTNSLVQNSIALSNTGIGFVDLTASQNAWLGNKAQNNTGGAYSGIAAGNISTYSKSTGAYAGGTAPNIYCTTNLTIIP